jgi:isopenicillin N synthase-like dioxygenase
MGRRRDGTKTEQGAGHRDYQHSSETHAGSLIRACAAVKTPRYCSPVIGIPTIEVSAIDDATGRRRIADEVLNAYGTVGFGYVVGHPIPQDLIDAVFEQSRRFHALPSEEKLRIRVDSSHRGYIPFKSSTDVTSSVDTVTKPNLSESLMMLRDLAPDHPEVVAGTYLAGANQWPDLPGFREVLAEYQERMTAFARAIIDVIAEALGDDGTMARAFDSPTTWLRLLHYPPQDPQSPVDEYGSAPHRDFGAITLLATDGVGGLSVRTVDGEWLDVPPVAGAFVMNVGDMLHRWSNGRLLSTPHRVTNRTGHERYSVPFFFDPHVDTVIAPLPGNSEPLFEPVVFGDFLRHELEASYDNHKPADEVSDR